MTDADAITFGTDGWRALLDEFTVPRVKMVGQAVTDYLDDAGVEGPIAIGYDARETSPTFAEALTEVITANDRDVLVAERDCPTPALAWMVGREAAGGLMITASHNPPEYNGVKFLPEEGAPALPDVTEQVEARLAEPASGPGAGEATEYDFIEPYVDHVLEFVDADLDGLSVVYDAMHGSGRGVTDAALERAGADVERIRCSLDPEFGGGAPEPVPERTEELVATVVDGGADLGVVNDGDADRLGIVTPERGFLDPNVLLAVLYEFVLDRRSGDCVRTVSTSSLVDRVAESHGHEVHETAVGFKWVAQAMADHDAVMGGEESGGFGLTSHLRNKDGVLVGALAAAAEREKPLDDRADDLFDAYGRIFQDRISVSCPDDRKGPVLEELEAELPETVAGKSVAKVLTVDGFKVVLADGTWLLMRPSGTEPKLRIYAEAGDEARVDELLAAGRELVEPLV